MIRLLTQEEKLRRELIVEDDLIVQRMAKRNKKEQPVNRAKITSVKPLVDDHVDNTHYRDKSYWDKDF